MADPVNYNRPGVSAQGDADQMAQYAARIAASKRMIAQEDRSAAAAGDQYAASLQRQIAAAREVAAVTEQGAAAIAGATSVRRGAAVATNQQAEADVRGAATARENAAAQTQAAVAARERAAAMQRAAFSTPSGTGRPLPMFMGGGGGGGGGGRPPAPSAGGEPPDRGAGAASTAASAERELASIRAAAGGQAASLSRDMRSYGALTTEFFAALARGEVTVSELGFQAAMTAAKFGSWTAAAGIIYGVVGAIRELKDGAVEAQSGVASLGRFVPNLNRGQAYQDLLNTSNQFVEPIKNVAEAQGAFARVTQDQAGSLAGARTAILASRLDNISLADSYRYLIAIMQEFNLPATSLPHVYDQIAAAQDRMGARAQEVLPAMAKAVGAVRTQGGDFNQLLALITVAQTTTGQTGSLIGTAMARGAANFFNSPSTLRGVGRSPLDIEKGYGIDTSLGFTQRLIQAIEKATASGNLKEQRELSQAFFGPLRGGLLAGLFRQAPRVQQAEVTTGPGAAAGLAMQQWEHQVGRADVQISALRVHTQNLGAELAKSGALQPFGWAIYGGNQALRVIDAMVHAFSQLPGPMKTAIEAGTVLLATMKGMGAFAGGALLNRVPVLGAVFGNPNAQYQAQLASGLRTGVASTQASAARIAGQGEQAAFTAEMDAKALAIQESRIARLKASGAAQAEIDAEEAKLAELEGQSQRSLTVAAEAGQKTILAKRVYAAQQAELAAVEKMTPAQAAAYGQSRNMAVRQGFSQAAAAAPLATMQAGGMGAEAAAIERVTSGNAAGQVGMLAAAKARYKIQVDAETRGYANYSRSAQGVIAAETGAISAEEKAAADAGVMAGATNSLNAGANFLTANLGKITIGLMVAVLGYEQLKGEMKKYDQAQKQLTAALETDPSDPGATGKLVSALKHASDVEHNVFTNAAHHIDVFFTGLANDVNNIFGGGDDAIRKLTSATVKPTDWQAAVKDAKASHTTGPLGWIAAGGVTALTGGAAAAAMAITGIHPHVNETDPAKAKEVAERASAALVPVWNGIVQQAQVAEALDTGTAGSRARAAQAIAALEAAARQDPAYLALKATNPKAAAAMLAALDARIAQAYTDRQQQLVAIAGPRLGTKDPYKPFESQPLANMTGAMGAWSDKVKAYGYDEGTVKNMAYGYTYLANKYAKSNDPKELQAVQTAREQYISAVQSSVQQLVDEANQTSNKGERASKLNAAKALIASQKGILQGARDDLVVAIAKKQSDAVTTQAALVAAQAANFFGDRTFAKALQAFVKSEHKIAGYVVQGTIGMLRSVPEFVTSAAALDAAEKTAQGLANAAEKAVGALTKNLGGLDKASANLLNAFSQPLKSLNSQLASNAKTPRTPASQDPFELTRLQRQLEQAQAWGDPVKQAQIAEQLAQQEMAAARNQHERLQAQIDLAQAQQQYDQAVQDTAQARFEYLKSLTTDPIKQAKIEVEAARQQVSFDAQHGGLNTAKGYQDRAKLNQANQTLVDQRISEREQTIEFNLKLQKISTETAIGEYQALLNIHGITKRTRQEVLSKIWDLQHASQSDFGALNLGTIRLPTPYEIRRAVLAAQAGINVTNHNSVTVAVPDQRTAGSVGAVMERVTGAPLTSTMRAAGMR